MALRALLLLAATGVAVNLLTSRSRRAALSEPGGRGRGMPTTARTDDLLAPSAEAASAATPPEQALEGTTGTSGTSSAAY